MKAHELIANLRDVDPDGEAEVALTIHLRWGSRAGQIADIRMDPDGVVRIIEAADPET